MYIYIDVTDPKTKKVTNWGFEMGPPHMLQKAGWKRNSLKIGEVVAVEGWLARDGSNTRQCAPRHAQEHRRGAGRGHVQQPDAGRQPGTNRRGRS